MNNEKPRTYDQAVEQSVVEELAATLIQQSQLWNESDYPVLMNAAEWREAVGSSRLAWLSARRAAFERSPFNTWRKNVGCGNGDPHWLSPKAMATRVALIREELAG